MTCLRSHSKLKLVYNPISLTSQSNNFIVNVSYPAVCVSVCMCVSDSLYVFVYDGFTSEYEK